MNWSSPEAMVGAIALAAGLLGVSLFLLVRPHRETIRERVLRFVRPADEGRRPGDDGHTGPLALFERRLARTAWWERFNEQLDVARIEMPAIRIVAATLVGTLFAAFLIWQVTKAPVLVPVAVLVPFGVRLVINRELRKQRQEFTEQLADNLHLVASALRAGQSMVGALSVVVEEADEPARTEFRRIVSDEQAGVPLEDAIRAVAVRMDSRDLEQVALVATIQRETGGNTAEVLDKVIETIRERGKLRRLMQTLTAQGRLTQIVVSILPAALLVAITLLNPDYMDPLFKTGGGQIALAIGVAFSVIGSVIIKRIVEMRV